MTSMDTQPMPQPAPIEKRLTDARISLLLLFALLGLSFSSWASRFPTVKAVLELDAKEFGVVLLAGAIGSLIFATIAGSLVQRFGGRAVLTVSAFGIALAFFLEGLAPTLGNTWLLAIGIFLNGCFVALTNVPQNVESAAIERRLGRAIIPHFHAAFSIGAVLGALIGAACAANDVPLIAQMTATAFITLGVRLVLIPRVILDTELTYEERWNRADASRRKRVVKAERKASGNTPPLTRTLAATMRARRSTLGSALGAWREPRTLFIGLIIFAAALSEGSASNWLAIAVVSGFAQPEAVGAIGLGIFLGSMTIVRIFGTRLIDAYGRVTVLRLSAIASILGLLLFGFGPHIYLAILGIVLWGMGAALAVPLGIAGASDDPIRAAARVSVVSAFASIASLAAPPVLGFVAEYTGTRMALTGIAVFILVSIVLSKAVAPLKPEQKVGYQHPQRTPVGE